MLHLKEQEIYCSMQKLFFSLLFSFTAILACSQTDAFLKKIQYTDSVNTYHAREKIFINYDKPIYNLNDTLWLKGYVFSATLNKAADSSAIAYVEIINENREIVKRLSFQCFSGTFFGNISLDQDNFIQGEYILRAYTRYLRNFGDSLFFESPFQIVDILAEEWKATVKEMDVDKGKLSLLTILRKANKQPLVNKRITVRLKSKQKNIFRFNTVTDNAGYIKIDTTLQIDNYKNLRLEITDRENVKLNLPLTIDGKQQTDLQFLPEGGKLIADKLQRIGFKAIDIFGKGVDVKGKIKDGNGNEVADFSSTHKGMGIVYLKPQFNEKYTAYTDNGLSFPLPIIQRSGNMLQVFNSANADSVKVIMDASEDLKGNYFYLSATSRGVNNAYASLRFLGKPIAIHLAKDMFPSGISRITLYDAALNPLCERVIFIQHADDIELKMQLHKEAYQKKDSVHLVLHAQNNRAENVVGSFSIAVIDTGQVKINPYSENIISYMLLSSELKGYIEDPYYYFHQPHTEALDALLLTQGWVNYTRDTFPRSFQYEKEFTIAGRVSDVFNRPARDVNVLLFAKMGTQNALVIDTITNREGRFIFKHFPVFVNDSVSTVIRALNKRGKAFNVGIELDKVDYPAYSSDFKFTPSQAIILDTLIKQYITDQEKIAEEMLKDKEYLGEVVVTTQAKIQGSKNLNEDGGADQTITENTLNNLAKETLLDVLYKKVQGFNQGMRSKSLVRIYKIHEKEVNFIIDGVELKWFYQASAHPDDYMHFLDSYLKYFSGEDIRGIEIMTSSKYKRAYSMEFLYPKNPFAVDWEIAYIEITTKTGEGPFMKRVPGIYLYKPMVPVIGKQFYSPKYISEEEQALPDFRSTVYWNPHVITDKDGKAQCSFYTSDSKDGYMIIVHGTDLTGGMGVLYQPLPRKEN